MWMHHVTHVNLQITSWSNALMSHIWMNGSCHTSECVTSHMWTDGWLCYQAPLWVMSHIWMSHVTHMNESCHIYEWVTSHIWMSHVTHMNASCHTGELTDSFVTMALMSHVTRRNESCHTCELTDSFVTTGFDVSCHTWEWVMLHVWTYGWLHDQAPQWERHTCQQLPYPAISKQQEH